MENKKAAVQKMGFLSLILFGINAVIGSGIFLLPSAGMKMFGPASILVLVFDAVLAFLIAMCFAECASYFKQTGGAYVYAKEAFGNFVGYEVGFVTWAIRIIAEATMYVAFATALGSVFPSLATSMAKDIIVTVLFIGLGLLNIAGVRLTTLISNVVTVGKLVPIFLVIICGLFFIKPTHFDPFFVQKLATTPNFAAAAITLFYIFTGFEGVVITAGDMKNVKKNLPKALLISLGTVVATYVLIMVVSIGVLGGNLAHSTAPLKDVFTVIAGNFGGNLVSFGTLLSIGGLCVASSFVTPRSGVALAENKMMPQVLAKKNRREAPYVAIVVSSAISLIIAFSGSFTALAQISAVSRFAQFIPTIIAVMVFRRTKKDTEHSFSMPFGPVIPVLALAVSAWLLWHVDVKSLIWGLGALLVAVPFYFFTGNHKKA
ncbi:APC family permease [Fructobacillus sp. M1-13]|uniref:Amino acid permease n=1 Tax=Fructobacillus papyriferae TaxID=2713171 RepID=A0ABS5QPE9_9LACO|nr:APC family permease [Fructobacillus papyriferae]MBS9335049.1 amino acid permease [Fructobacillus papyriferae]MCD2159465.1 APC family permease [Fructobacillus papyriferae]